MGPIVFAAILLVLWFGQFQPLRLVPLLWWVGGGGGAYFAKKIDLSIFIPRLLYVNKQDDMLISDMVSKIIDGFLTNSSEHFLFLIRHPVVFGFPVKKSLLITIA